MTQPTLHLLRRRQRPVRLPRPGAAAAAAGGCAERSPPCTRGTCTGCGATRRSTAPTRDALAALLRYGDAYAGPTDGALVVVTPRLGTVSPWASKATDIAHNCGLAIHRVERVTECRLTLKSGLLGGAKPLAADELRPLRRAAARPHDRERGCSRATTARHLFDAQPGKPMEHVDVLAAAGGAALVAANGEFGLALSDDEIDYLVDAFTALAAQPDRRRADDVRAGQQRALPPQDLQRATSRSTAWRRNTRCSR